MCQSQSEYQRFTPIIASSRQKVSKAGPAHQVKEESIRGVGVAEQRAHL
jgi:hypothetical protein